jgi:ribosome-binding factor A
VQPLSQRQLQVGEIIKRTLADILIHDVYDASLEGTSIIVSEVVVTRDLKLAKVYVLPMIGSKLSNTELLAALKRVSHQIRHALSKKAQLRYTPELQFHIDDTFEKSAKIESLLNKAGNHKQT